MPRRLALLAASLALAGLLLGCANPSGSDPGASARATRLAQTAAALLTSTAAASITPMTATPLPSITPVPSATPTASPVPPTATATPPPPSPTPCAAKNDAAFVADVSVPDNTHFAPGTAFSKTWRLSNTGVCTWSTSYQFLYISGDMMGGTAARLANEVPPGGMVEVTVNFVAPTAKGNYLSHWQMHSPDGTPFGTKPYVAITVP